MQIIVYNKQVENKVIVCISVIGQKAAVDVCASYFHCPFWV